MLSLHPRIKVAPQEVHFFDNETNYRYRIRPSKKVFLDCIKKAPEAPQKSLLMEVHFFDNETNYRYRIRGASKRSFYGGPLLRQRDQLQVQDQRHLKKVLMEVYCLYTHKR